jgi:hypothetical protein
MKIIIICRYLLTIEILIQAFQLIEALEAKIISATGSHLWLNIISRGNITSVDQLQKVISYQ